MTSSFGQTMIIDRCQSAHKIAPVGSDWSSISSSFRGRADSERTIGLDLDDDEEQQIMDGDDPPRDSYHNLSLMVPLTSAPSYTTPLQQPSRHEYGSTRQRKHGSTSNKSNKPKESIRFQVVVWDVGPVDVALGRVPMTFRVSLFWDDIEHEDKETGDEEEEAKDEPGHHTEWHMQGRRKAYERVVKDNDILKTVDVPPLSLLNVVTFDVIGSPEVCVLREQQRIKGAVKQKRRLMRWTCLYKATLMQQDMKLNQFPHDEQVLKLKLAILVHRRPGARWDMSKYRLDLATEDDSQHSTRVPHGLIVDHVRVPNFKYNAEEGLDFQFVPLSYGAAPVPPGSYRDQKSKIQQDRCLEVCLRVQRDSGYYDKNIMPLIGLLNVVAVAIPMSLECTCFFQRGLMLLNITFVQIGIRMNVDKHLPSVGYQIKMQRIMNQFFFSLLLLVLESSLVYVLHEQYSWTFQATHRVDNVASLSSFGHIIFSWVYYYHSDWLQRPQKAAKKMTS